MRMGNGLLKVASGLLIKETIIIDINGHITLIPDNSGTELLISWRKTNYEFKTTQRKFINVRI